MSANPNKITRFWQELKRRRVVHVITVYASASFVIIELANNLTEPLNLPPRLTTIVVVILAVGFPLAVILSWIYDLTAGGIERTKPLEDNSDAKKPKVPNAWRIATYVSFVVIIGLVTLNIVGGPKKLKAGDIQSLLVLPFENFTGDDQLDFVAAGMHSSLIGDIGQISALRIISKTTARIYKDMEMSLPDIASELNADAVVEPTVMCYGDSVCIQIRVITPFPEERQLWIGEYKEDKSKILNLYNQVTKQIADEVQVQLTPGEVQKLAESRTINSEAYDYYLQGLYYWDLFTPEALQLALEYFNKAVEIDPEWAEPYAGIAYVWVAVRQFDLAPSSVSIPNLYQNLNKAIELDPNSTFVHYVNALTACATEFDWEKSEKEYLTVLNQNPNDAFGHMYYAHLLTSLRRMEEAHSHCRIALDLDPLNPMIQGLSTLVLIETEQYDEALSTAQRILTVLPDHPVALANMSGIHALKGEYRETLEYWARLFRIDENTRKRILEIYEQQGLSASLRELAGLLEQIEGFNLPLMDLGQIYALAGDDERALYYYERALDERHPMMIYFNISGVMKEPFKIDNPRIDSILVKMNLPRQ